MTRFQSFWAAVPALLAAALLPGPSAYGEAPVEGPAEAPGFVGTWHVLIHYQVPGGPHPERWKWDERVWVIEPADDGLEWIEHAIVTFHDSSGRFEHLGTNRARRLIGAWEPNERQREEIERGLAVSGRGMRRKHLREVEPGLWRSDTGANTIGQSSSGLGYNEAWSIRQDATTTQFTIDPRFSISTATREESGGATIYRATLMRADRFDGGYARDDERRGRFRLSRTQILIPADDDAADPSARPKPLTARLIDMVADRTVQSDVPIVFTVLRPFHYYASRRLVVDSTPPGAEIDIAYLRRGSQLMYRRGRAPVELLLPTRLQTASSDRLLIRGFLPGHERTRTSLAIDEADEKLHLDLEPLSNQLMGVSHGAVFGRTVLELRTKELPSVRLSEDETGWTIVMLRTGLRPEIARHLAALRDPGLSFDARQLGDDFVLRVDAGDRGRSTLRQYHLDDPSRRESRTRIRIDGPAADRRADQLRALVSGMGASSGSGGDCGAAYERSLREELSSQEYSAVLGRDDHPYRATLRAALRQLAANDAGQLRTRSGEELGTTTPLEFERAWLRSAEIEGYLLWLRDLSQRIEPADEGALVFRSLIAPNLSPARFDTVLTSAVDSFERCQARARAK